MLFRSRRDTAPRRAGCLRVRQLDVRVVPAHEAVERLTERRRVRDRLVRLGLHVAVAVGAPRRRGKHHVEGARRRAVGEPLDAPREPPERGGAVEVRVLGVRARGVHAGVAVARQQQVAHREHDDVDGDVVFRDR